MYLFALSSAAECVDLWVYSTGRMSKKGKRELFRVCHPLISNATQLHSFPSLCLDTHQVTEALMIITGDVSRFNKVSCSLLQQIKKGGGGKSLQ